MTSALKIADGIITSNDGKLSANTEALREMLTVIRVELREQDIEQIDDAMVRQIQAKYGGEIVANGDAEHERAKSLLFILKGGPGSGHHGHAGRPGEVGGSAPDDGGGGGMAGTSPTETLGAAMPIEDNPTEKLRKVFEEKYLPIGESLLKQIDGETVDIVTKNSIPSEPPQSFIDSEIDSQYEYAREKYSSKYAEDKDKQAVIDKARELWEEENSEPSHDEYIRDVIGELQNTSNPGDVSSLYGDKLGLVIDSVLKDRAADENLTPQVIADAVSASGLDFVTPSTIEAIRQADTSDFNDWKEETIQNEIDNKMEKAREDLIQKFVDDWSDDDVAHQQAWDDLDDETKKYYSGDSEESEEPVTVDAAQIRAAGKAIDEDAYKVSHAASAKLYERFCEEVLKEHYPNARVSEPDIKSIMGRGNAMFADWVTSSSSDGGKDLMAAARDVLGAKGNSLVRGVEVVTRPGDEVPKFTHADDRAAVKAAWLTAQTLLKNENVDYLDLYRGIEVPPDKIANGLLPGEVLNEIKPSLLQSATTQPSVAKKFGNVVIRMRVPREMIVSVPAQGKNEHEEEEYIVMGGAWMNYDAWKREHLPSEDKFNFAAERKPVLKSKPKPIIIPPTSFAEERRKLRTRRKKIRNPKK